MKLVKLSRPDGSDVYVNSSAVVTVAAAHAGHTQLIFGGGAMQVVKGELDDIVSNLQGEETA